MLSKPVCSASKESTSAIRHAYNGTFTAGSGEILKSMETVEAAQRVSN